MGGCPGGETGLCVRDLVVLELLLICGGMGDCVDLSELWRWFWCWESARLLWLLVREGKRCEWFCCGEGGEVGNQWKGF